MDSHRVCWSCALSCITCTRVFLLFVLCLCLFSTNSVTSATRADFTRTCEPIRIDMCRGLGYNSTGMPNLVGHELQQDAELQFQTFTPLIQYRCSSQLKFFLCSVYVPMCTEKVETPIGPCRSLCEAVKGRCQAVLQEFGFYWPSALNCSKFAPWNDENHMCMEGPKIEDGEYPYPSVSLAGTTSSSVVPQTVLGRPNNHYGLCYHYKYPEKYYYINRTGRCAQSCAADILFSKHNKDFSNKFTLVTSLLCFASVFYAILSYVMTDSSHRIHYPERVIYFVSIPCAVVSLAYFVRFLANKEQVSCHLDSQYGQSILIQEGTDNIYCTIVFVLLYYFSMASMVWWVILTITWFMGTGLRQSHEEIERRCSYFHVAAWGLPGLKVIAILVMRLVDGDELTGMCYVGNQSRAALLGFVIIPSAIYIGLAFCFLVAGLICVVRAKTNQVRTSTSLRMRHGSHRSTSSSHISHPHLLSHTTISSSLASTSKDKHDHLNIRVLVFAAFYMLPSSCILGANVYEYVNRDSWYQLGSTERPNVEVFVFKIFMSMIVGMKSGFWVWTRTPWSVWSRIVHRVKKKPIPAYLTAPTLVQKQYSVVSTNVATLDKRPQTATLSRHWKSSGGETTV